MRNNRLAVAVHIICAIEKFTKEGHIVNSNFLAKSVNTNPAAIRRTIAILAKAKIIYVKKGYHVKGFEQLSLYDVQKAVDPKVQMLYAHANANKECPIGSKIENTMNMIYNELQIQIEKEMKQQMLSEIIKEFN